MTFATMAASGASASWLDAFTQAAQAAETAEQSYRADFNRRLAELAEARAIAHRRVNLMAALAESEAGCEEDKQAVAHGLAVLRSRLGWSQESEARTEILDRFAPVCAAVYEAGRPEEAEAERPRVDPAIALAEFEAWYRDARGHNFWTLFENVMPETPLVDW